MKVDKKKVQLLAREGGEFVFKPEAEKKIIELLEIKEYVEKEYEKMLLSIGEAGKSLHSGFKGAKGEYIDAIYRVYGQKYSYSSIKEAKPFLKEKVSHAVDSKLVDDYLVEHGDLPKGIVEKDREPKLSIKFKDERKLIGGEISEKL